MSKYLAMFSLGLKNALEYRAALLTWILVEIVSLTSALFLWTGIFSTRDVVGSYNYKHILMYYFFIPVVGSITSAHISDKLPRRIKDGEITKDIIKPYSYILGFLINQFSIKLIQNTIKIPVYLVVGLILFQRFQLSVSPPLLFMGFAVGILGYVLHVTLDTALSLAAFWFDDTWSLSLLKYVSLMIFGGLTYPLDLIPALWRPIFAVLPFDLIYYFPVSLILGRIDPPAVVFYLIKLVIWTSIFVLLIRFLWTRGVRKYGAYGH